MLIFDKVIQTSGYVMSTRTLRNELPEKRLVVLFIIIFFAWFCWKPYFLSFFDDHIIRYLYIRTGLLTHALFAIIGLCILYAIITGIRRRYTTSYSHILLLLSAVVIYFDSRYGNGYMAAPNWFGFVGYSDILAGLAALFSLSCLVCRFYTPEKKSDSDESEKKSDSDETEKKSDSDKTRSSIIPDLPITSHKDDRLDYRRDVLNLCKTIENLPADISHSIGIISPWGSGKTSYMNMVKERMKDDRFILVDFNPRHSKKTELIQEDFFQELCSQLKVYNGEFSTLFEDYLDALNIIDKKGFASWLRVYDKLTARADRKERLQAGISRLNRRIVVFIEDFDRLLDVEIVEVFKLLDENASFGNIIFISAYDKEHLRRLLGQKYDNEEGKFSDKFFTLEVYLPRRPYEKILDYVALKLEELLSWDEPTSELRKAWLRRNRDVIKKYISTLRDAKRFLNLFLRDYAIIKDEVVFGEYFLVSLIKYKYPQELNALYEQKYLTRRDMASQVFQIIKDCDARSSDIIEMLFPDSSSSDTENYKSIRYESSFHKYFENYVHGILSVEQMNKLLDPATDSGTVERILAGWNAEEHLQDLLDYLNFKELFSYGSKERFERYVDILFRISPYVNPYIHIARLITRIHTDQLLQTYGYDNLVVYKQFIDSKFRDGEYSYLTRQLILDSCSTDSTIEFIFSKDEILEWSKSYLDRYIETDASELNVYKNLLYSCIADVDKVSQKISLDAGACEQVRQLIDRHPCSYLDRFVFLGGRFSSPDSNSIACEPFWEQIFGSADAFETFINDPARDTCDKIDLVRNFWRLYKRNDYKQLRYEGMGNVQEKIDNALREEIGKLDRLEAIERKYEAAKAAFAADSGTKATYHDTLKQLCSEIEQLQLPTQYKADVQIRIALSLKDSIKPETR